MRAAGAPAGRPIHLGLHHREGSRERSVPAGDQLLGTRTPAVERMNAQPDIRPETREWQRLDSAHYLHPFTDYKALAARGARIVTRADGVYIYTSEGEKILDGMAGLWCVALGYGRKELADAAYR